MSELDYGWHVGLTEQEYDAIPGYSQSSLKLGLESWKTYYYRQSTPEPPNDGMKLGSMLDRLLFEEDSLSTYAVKPAGLRRGTKAFEEWYEGIPDDKVIVSQGDLDCALSMQRAIMATSLWRWLAEQGERVTAQPCAFWRHEESGLPMRARMDLALVDDGCVGVIDIKQAHDASLAGFGRAVGNYGYHIQVAHYLEGIQACFPDAEVEFNFLVVSPDPPYNVALYELDQEAVQCGAATRARLIMELAECVEKQRWPQPIDYGKQTITLPQWALSSEEKLLAAMSQRVIN